MFLTSSSAPLLMSAVSLWGFIFAVKRYAKLQVRFIPLFVLSSLVIIEYFACFLSVFKIINFALMVVGNLLLLWEVFLTAKDLFNKKLNLKSYLLAQKTILFFIFSSIVLFFYVNNASLYGWDEFFWGQFSKFVHEYGHFWHLGDAVLSSHSVYPPMVAISQNLFMPFGVFNEETMFFANLLPIIFVLTYFFDSLLQKNNKKNFLQFIIITFLVAWAYFYFGFTNFNFASVDHAMAMIFTMVLLFLFDNRKSTKSLLFLLPSLFFLSLYKTTGVLLAASLAIIFILSKFINALKEKKINSIKNNFLLVLVFSFTIFLAFFSWKKYTEITQLASNRTSQRQISSLNQLDLGSTYFSQVVINFSNALSNKSLNYGVGIGKNIPQVSSLVFWFIFILLLQAIAISSKKNYKKQELVIFFLLLNTCFICWILFHLYVWLFVFSEYEGLLLASYERYINTFLVAIFIFSIYLLGKEASKNKKILIFLTVLTIFLNLSFSITKKSIIAGPKFFIDRNRFVQTTLAAKVQSKIKEEKAKIWYVNQNSIGYEAMIFRYEVSPKYYVPVWHWSLGQKYYPEDVWTVNLSLPELQDLLLGKGDNPSEPYKYIVLEKVDRQFQEQYGALFSAETDSNTLWRLEENNGSLLAIPISF